VRRGQKGQLMLLVLVLLAVGSVILVPLLRLSQTAVTNTGNVDRIDKGVFVVDAAQHVAMWKLLRGGLTSNMSMDGDTVDFTVSLCSATADISITMKAVENESGVVLSANYTMLPMKTVSPDIMAISDFVTLTYIIELKQVSSNNTADLEYIYDILPKDLFTGNSLDDVYELGSSETSLDGASWTSIGDPLFETSGSKNYGGQIRLRWPATGNFTDEAFKNIGVANSHYLRFNAFADSPNQDGVHCNWAVIQAGAVPTPSGPQASVIVGDENQDRDLCANDGVFSAWKTSSPEIIPPLVETAVTYTIHITNTSGSSQRIGRVEDILPPGFRYISENASLIDGASVNNTILQAYSENRTFNGVERQATWWESGNDVGDQLTNNGWSMAAGENITLTFRALASQGVSGSYFNEVFITDVGGTGVSAIFTDIGLESGSYSTYSWNSGTVIVPAYDSETTSGSENITANFGLDINGITINSWQVK